MTKTPTTNSMIFVFGSNDAGIHGAGAAKYALDHKGARYGKSYGHHGQSFALPSDEPALLMALRRQAAMSPAARVDGDITIPYKCFGYAVYVAQRAGFKRVGFIAEPPPPPPSTP